MVSRSPLVFNVQSLLIQNGTKLIVGWPSSLLENIIEASATGTNSFIRPIKSSKCFLKSDILKHIRSCATRTKRNAPVSRWLNTWWVQVGNPIRFGCEGVVDRVCLFTFLVCFTFFVHQFHPTNIICVWCVYNDVPLFDSI